MLLVACLALACIGEACLNKEQGIGVCWAWGRVLCPHPVSARLSSNLELDDDPLPDPTSMLGLHACDMMPRFTGCFGQVGYQLSCISASFCLLKCLFSPF